MERTERKNKTKKEIWTIFRNFTYPIGKWFSLIPFGRSWIRICSVKINRIDHAGTCKQVPGIHVTRSDGAPIVKCYGVCRHCNFSWTVKRYMEWRWTVKTKSKIGWNEELRLSDKKVSIQSLSCVCVRYGNGQRKRLPYYVFFFIFSHGDNKKMTWYFIFKKFFCF